MYFASEQKCFENCEGKREYYAGLMKGKQWVTLLLLQDFFKIFHVVHTHIAYWRPLPCVLTT